MKKRLLTLSLIISYSLFNHYHATAQIRDFSQPTDKYFEISKNIEIFTNIFKELNKSYVDPIEPGKMIKTGVDAMLADLDPYTNFYTETDKEDAQFMATGKYGGIGAGLQLIDSNIFIGEIYEGSPAHKVGLKAGDKIISINDIAVTGKKEEEISLLLRGAPGTSLDIKIEHPISKKVTTKTLERGAIQIKSVPLHKLIGNNKDIAYVSLTQFTGNCAQEIAIALEELKKEEPNLKGVVLDLRSNPGGLLGEAVKICNLFLPKGKLIVSTKGKLKEHSSELVTKNEPWDPDIPLAILINSSSASASEVVSGTIQDYDRGVVIGVKSYGKGLVQNIVPLGYNTGLKLTIAKYYTPSGRCIQAIDYTHRNADGSVSVVPDSLKRSFKTENNRTVYDGGGIEPDIITKDSYVNRALIALMADGQIFNYATQYYYKHKKIAAPENFFISDNEFKDFRAYVAKNNYNYKSISEQLTASLKDVLKKENYLDETQKALEQLNQQITKAKAASIENNKEKIKQILSNEIVSRYYYQKGRVVNRIYHNDKDLELAIETLSNIEEKYKPLLKP